MTGRQSLLFGLVAFWACTIVVAFIAGCLYAASLDMGPSLGAEIHGTYRTTSAPLSIILLTGSLAAIATIPLSAVATLAFGLPIFGFLLHRECSSIPAYVAAGAVISVGLIGILIATHRSVGDLATRDSVFVMVAIAVAEPLGGITFLFTQRRAIYG